VSKGRWKQAVTGQNKLGRKQYRQRLVNQSIGSQLDSTYIDYTGWTSLEGIRPDYVGSMVSILYV